MSGERSIYNAGAGIFIEDDQVLADNASTIDDRVYDVLAVDEPLAVASSVGTKTVTPLVKEYGPSGAVFGGNTAADTVRQHVLVAPSLTALGGENGRVLVAPALYQRGAVAAADDVGLPRISMAHCQYADMSSALLGANASGSTKYVALYGTIARATNSTDTRLVRNSQDVESEQSLVLTTITTLTLTLTAQQTSRANALAAIPADAAGSYSFLLAYIPVGNGYASGDAIGRNSAAGTLAYIEQAWTAGAIPQHRVRNLQLGKVAATSGASGQSILLSSRTRAKTTILVPFLHTTNPQTITLDDTINFARRKVDIRLALPVVDGGAYKSADNIGTVSNAGVTYESSVQAFTGTENQTFKRITLGGKTYDFKTTADGYLQVTCGAAPNDGGAGDNWWCEIDVSPPFDKGAF